eukprot:9383512-Alexandrium_andersonii.AAC.1
MAPDWTGHRNALCSSSSRSPQKGQRASAASPASARLCPGQVEPSMTRTTSARSSGPSFLQSALAT